MILKMNRALVVLKKGIKEDEVKDHEAVTIPQLVMDDVEVNVITSPPDYYSTVPEPGKLFFKQKVTFQEIKKRRDRCSWYTGFISLIDPLHSYSMLCERRDSIASGYDSYFVKRVLKATRKRFDMALQRSLSIRYCKATKRDIDEFTRATSQRCRDGHCGAC